MNLYKEFENKNIIKNGHFILRSGKHSDTYINKAEITLFPYLYKEIIRNITNEITKYYKFNEYDAITGPAVAGISFASPIAIELSKPFMFSEKNKKYKNEFQFRPEFIEFIYDKKIIIIEDIITTGGSVNGLADAIYHFGGYPVSIFCIMNRNPELKEIKGTIYPYSIPIYSLITKDIQSWNNETECPMCRLQYLNKKTT